MSVESDPVPRIEFVQEQYVPTRFQDDKATESTLVSTGQPPVHHRRKEENLIFLPTVYVTVFGGKPTSASPPTSTALASESR